MLSKDAVVSHCGKLFVDVLQATTEVKSTVSNRTFACLPAMQNTHELCFSHESDAVIVRRKKPNALSVRENDFDVFTGNQCSVRDMWKEFNEYLYPNGGPHIFAANARRISVGFHPINVFPQKGTVDVAVITDADKGNSAVIKIFKFDGVKLHILEEHCISESVCSMIDGQFCFQFCISASRRQVAFVFKCKPNCEKPLLPHYTALLIYNIHNKSVSNVIIVGDYDPDICPIFTNDEKYVLCYRSSFLQLEEDSEYDSDDSQSNVSYMSVPIKMYEIESGLCVRSFVAPPTAYGFIFFAEDNRTLIFGSTFMRTSLTVLSMFDVKSWHKIVVTLLSSNVAPYIVLEISDWWLLFTCGGKNIDVEQRFHHYSKISTINAIQKKICSLQRTRSKFIKIE